MNDELDELMRQWRELHQGQALLYRLINKIQSDKDGITAKIKAIEGMQDEQ